MDLSTGVDPEIRHKQNNHIYIYFRLTRRICIVIMFRHYGQTDNSQCGYKDEVNIHCQFVKHKRNFLPWVLFSDVIIDVTNPRFNTFPAWFIDNFRACLCWVYVSFKIMIRNIFNIVRFYGRCTTSTSTSVYTNKSCQATSRYGLQPSWNRFFVGREVHIEIEYGQQNSKGLKKQDGR